MPRFRSKARLVEILGEHLIKDNTVGLLELVKNAYDADATEVEVRIENINDPGNTVVTVTDNGRGMDLATLCGPWLEPAHGGKEVQKKASVKSKRGRLPLGEKGVGRFAAHKLGKTLVLVSRAENAAKEVVLDLDWAPFENHDSYLDDIPVHPKERPPELFTGDNTGTRLTMRSSREPWRRDHLRRLQASLQRLKSPLKGAKDFSVKLVCPDAPEFEDLENAQLLNKAHFILNGIIGEDGIIEFDYRYCCDGRKGSQKAEKADLWRLIHRGCERLPACGPFYVSLHVWIRKAELLKQTGVTKEQLNAFQGVSVFRDGIRVLPYGDEGDDWLLLDKRRIDDPTRRFANNQIAGFVEISQSENASLVDKANREGFQESQAYYDMRDLVSASVRLLEQYSAGERSKATTKTKTGKTKDTVVTTIKEIQDAAKDSELRAQAVVETVKNLEAEGWIKPEAAKQLSKQVTTLTKQVVSYRQKAETANETVAEVFSDDEKERETFLHLVAVGLVAERLSHELSRLDTALSGTLQQLLILTKNDKSAKDAVKDIQRTIGQLHNELVPLTNVVKRSQGSGAKECNVVEVLEAVLRGNEPRLRLHNIQSNYAVQNGATLTAAITESALAQVFDNIIDNAIYWLGEKSAQDDRHLVVYVDVKQQTILISNNGMPLAPHIRGQLFQKFSTTKYRGRGLGLFICHELLSGFGAEIRFTDSEEDPRCLSGASFVVDLSNV